MSDKTNKKYMKKSEIATFGIGLFGVGYQRACRKADDQKEEPVSGNPCE